MVEERGRDQVSFMLCVALFLALAFIVIPVATVLLLAVLDREQPAVRVPPPPHQHNQLV